MAGPGEIPSTGGLGDIQGLLDIFKQIFGAPGSETDSTTESPIALQGIQQLMGILMPQIAGGNYSREQAITDSQGEVDDIIRQMKEGGIPLITQQANNSGAYNSSTASLLANDLTARSAAQGALTRQKTIESYGRMSQNQVTAMIALLNAGVNAQRNVTTKNTNQGLKDNPAARNTALAALLAGLLGGKDKKPGSGSPNPKDPNKNPAARRPGDTSSPTGAPTGTGSAGGGDEGNTPSGGTSDGDAADREAEGGYPYTPIGLESDESAGLDLSKSLGIDDGPSIFNSSDPDFLSSIGLGDYGDLGADIPNPSDILFFGDDGQDYGFDVGDIPDPTDVGVGDDLGDPFGGVDGE